MGNAVYRFTLWSLVAAVIAALAMTLQFRNGFAEPAAYTLAASGSRWALALIGGALFGYAGCKLPEVAVKPLAWLALSTGAAIGAALGWLWLGAAGAVVLFVVFSAALALAARWVPDGWLTAFVCFLLAGSGIYAVSLVNAEPNLGAVLAHWAVGDLRTANLWSVALGVGVMVVATAYNRTATDALAMGTAVGLVGPIAFVAWWVPQAESRLCRLSGNLRVAMCAIAGGVVVLTVDATQRWLIGSYGFGLNLPLTMLGVPFLLWWSGARVLAVLSIVASLGFTTIVVQIIQSAT